LVRIAIFFLMEINEWVQFGKGENDLA
jgi:hypothetical protein